MLPLSCGANLLNVSKSLTRTNWQFVRFNLRHKRKEPFRKPIWQPTAPSKLYRIKKPEQFTAEEQAQRDHLTETYTINMKSIKQFLNKEFYLPTLEAGGLAHEDVVKEEDEQKQLIAENNRENETVAKMREERLKEFSADKEAQLIAKKIQIDEENKRLGEELDVVVRREIERSKTYVTKDNLDAYIEEVLTHQTDYDFAIDTNGKIVFSGSLHPYALTPKAVPETSSNTAEYKNVDSNKPVYLKARKLY